MDFLFPKCTSFRGSLHLLILVLMFASGSTSFSYIQASGENCKAKDISADYEHCRIHPDGVHNLDCYRKYNSKGLKDCTWEPGINATEKKYTVITQFKNRCKIYRNITGFYQQIPLFSTNGNLSVKVFENTETTECTQAIFQGSPVDLLRCGPPNNVSFHRPSGGLHVNVSWPKEDERYITSFSVRYKVLGSSSWNEAQISSQSGDRVENLTSSLVYNVQVRCVTSRSCPQCPWSKVYTVPSALTMQPAIVNFQYDDIPQKRGCRMVFITWKFSAKGMYDGFTVSVGKVSGEPPLEHINTSEPEIRLILSYSAYRLNIRAYNNVSISPAASHTVLQRQDTADVGSGRLNVTVHNNSSFTIHWKDDMSKKYVCYSVEWWKNGHPALYRSFYQDTKYYRTLSSLPEPLEPYKRYSIAFLTRPNKQTCNMKHVNNSESTYGTTQFYFTEGSPVGAPSNVSSLNVSAHSVVLMWSSIPEEELRGFLLGYIIHYTEYSHRWTSVDHNITVDPAFNSFELEGLKSGQAYQVQMSAFTSAGAGVRSAPVFFKTDTKGHSNPKDFYLAFGVVVIVLIIGSPFIKRVSTVLWPSVPDPASSSAVQKIDRPGLLELLESAANLSNEDWDTKSLQIIEKEVVTPTATSPSVASMLPLLSATEDEGDSSEMTWNWTHGDRANESRDLPPEASANTFLDAHRTAPPSSHVLPSDYTTMEMFQQLMPADPVVPPATGGKPEEFPLVRLGSNYVRQFSTSPTSDSEMSTIL
ncbi:interleukin-31 receptor subunit alpha [Menidia menidia]